MNMNNECICKSLGYTAKRIRNDGHNWACPETDIENKNKYIEHLQETNKRIDHYRELMRETIRAHQGKLAILRHENNRLRAANERLKHQEKSDGRYKVLYWEPSPKREKQEFTCMATDPDDAHEQWTNYMQGIEGYWEYEIVEVRMTGKRSQV